jgi:cold shock CspA family protein
MTVERQTGVIRTWKEDRGYGFLRTEDHRDVFMHVSQWVETDEPRKGDKVTFVEDVGRDGRTFARQVMRA